jgi:hypothetical protein
MSQTEDDMEIGDYVALTDKNMKMHSEVTNAIAKYIRFLYDERGLGYQEIKNIVGEVGLHVLVANYQPPSP